MGDGQSKLRKENHFSQSRESLSSTKDAITLPQIEFYAKIVKELKEEILNIGDTLTDLKYDSYQVTLTNYWKEIVNLQGTLKRKRARVCEEILKNIAECLRLLVDKKESADFLQAQYEREKNINVVVEEERNVNNDESTKLIKAHEETEGDVNDDVERESNIATDKCQTPSPTFATEEYARSKSLNLQQPKPKSRQNRSKTKNLRFEEIVLEEVNEKVLRLRTDIDSVIEMQLAVNYKEYETAIKDYYTELELISNPNNSKYVRDKKDELCKILIKYNNKLRKYKTARGDKGKEIDPQLLQAAYDIQNKLKEFENLIESDDNNKETEHVREIICGYKTKLEQMEGGGNSQFCTLKRNIFDKMSLLERDLTEKQHRNKLKEQIRQLGELVDEFDGGVKDDRYVFLDQNLRRIWSKLSNKTDKDLIEIVKGTLVTLNYKVQSPEVQMDGTVFSKLNKEFNNRMRHDSIKFGNEPNEDDIESLENDFESDALKEQRQEETHEIVYGEKQILNQIVEYENHWNQLYFNIRKSTVTEGILTALERVFEGMYENLEHLADVYNRENLSDDEQREVKEHASTIENEIRRMLPKDELGDEINLNETVHDPLESVDDKASKGTSLEINKQPTTIDDVSVVEDVFYDDVPTNKTTNGFLKRSYTFTDLQNIQKEVNNISKELFSNNIDPYDLKKRLNMQKTCLQQFVVSGNETLELTKEKILKNIDDTHVLVNDHFAYLQQGTQKDSLNELRIYEDAKQMKEVEKKVVEIKRLIEDFKGIERDDEYRSIEEALEESYEKMSLVKCEESKLLMATIKKLNEELPKRLIRNQTVYVHKQSNEINELRRIIEEVQELRRNANDFDANNLKKQFNECLTKIDDIDDKNNEKAQIAKVQIKQKILQYLKNIEVEVEKDESCAKVESPIHLEKSKIIQVEAPKRINSTMYFEEQTTILENKELQTIKHAEHVTLPLNHPENPYHQIEEVRHKLIDIKASMDWFKGNYKDKEYNELEDRIFQCNDYLNNIDGKGSKLIHTSKAQYKDYVQKLLKYFEASVSGYNYFTCDQNNMKEDLNETKDKLDKLREKVYAFNGTKEEYLRLKEELLAEKVNLEYMTTKSDQGLLESKENLLTIVLKLLKNLKGKSKRYSELPQELVTLNELITIKNDLIDIENEISRFNGTKNDANYIRLDESLINLVIRLDKLEIGDDPSNDSDEFKVTKSQLILQLQTNLNLLHDKSKLPDFIKLRNSELLTTDV